MSDYRDGGSGTFVIDGGGSSGGGGSGVPVITSQPVGGSISAPGTVSLSVTGTGSNLTYQWYWVRVSNSSGSVDSDTAVVTVDSVSSGLVGYWPLDGSTRDLSPYANNGVAYGGLGFVQGHVGQCGDFDDRGNKYVEISHQPQYAFTSSWTIAFWFKSTTPITGGTVLEKHFGTIDPGNTWEMTVGTDSTFTFRNPFNADLTTAAGVTAGGWNHVALTYIAAEKRLQFFLNGRPDRA